MNAPALPPDAAEALAYLAQRHSVGPKHQHGPAPGAAELAQALALAERAPDHEGLRPWRFVQVPDAQRDALAELFAQDAQARNLPPDEVQRARERAHNGPALLALVCRIQPGQADVPEHEQWLSAGAALMNFLNGLHLLGYGAKVLSGASVRAAAIQAAFCGPGEQLAAWVTAGSLRSRPRPRPQAERQAGRLTVWAGPALG